ncbi:MAG TPA: helix-turn-helix domain-containing protein, partial [Acidiferrobacterales bacterium]|nr:helix-turn-helix domain-containing protein [Acidiferrobacterales bacterium]
MKKEDFRTIGNEARAVIRRRAVALVVSRGQSRQEAADILGVSRQTVSGWLQRYEASGQPGLDDGRRNEHRRDSGI